MYAVEFQAPIENGRVSIPKDYQDMYENQEVQVFIMPIKSDKRENLFNPRDYFGIAKKSKEGVDKYLKSSKNEWDNYINEK